ncbi:MULTISPECIES: amidohydrolase/deacetylase family metallohydrolase [unclassified Streptomyces]|nr:amidohydrolase/deacetylase family metallohydrolase [Streptomyces sp. NBC_01280]WSE18784.1 amidohydrolase/deacetylase family metallohydrolase [Streptomyces sp. NBC_01397]
MAVQASDPNRFDLVILGGQVVDPERGTVEPGDVALAGDRIAAVGPAGTLDPAGAEVYDATGLLVTPGLIDLHTHIYDGATGLGVPADLAGVRQGVTTVVDAGSCGSDHWPHFASSVVAPAATRVLSWLNISRHGLVHGTKELVGGAADIDVKATDRILADNPAVVRGLKIRMSRSVLGDSGLAPLRTAREIAAAHALPVMVHVGNAPPAFGDVLDLLGPGDVVTHAFHGKPGGLFGDGAEPLPQVRAALERGIRFDVGHGSASFAFDTAERALAAGIRPYTISTDLHARNMNGPVRDLCHTLSKLLALGMSLPEVIRCATTRPAEVLGMAGELGSLRPGAAGDLSLLEDRGAPDRLTDSQGVTRPAGTRLAPVATVRAGRPMPIRKATA